MRVAALAARWRTPRLLLCAFLLWPALALIAQTLGVAGAGTMILAGVPALVVLLLVSRRTDDREWRHVAIGLAAGTAATLAYDGVRIALALLGVVTDPFRTIHGYGALFAESPTDAAVIGWLLHFWNGAAFGAFFSVALGAPRIWKGVAWGIFLELAQVATSPRLLRLTIEGELLTASALGHLAYGVALARVAQLLVRR